MKYLKKMDNTIKGFILSVLVGVVLGVLAIIFDITFILYEPYHSIIRVIQIVVITSVVCYLAIRFIYNPLKNKRNKKNISDNERTNDA